MAENTFIIRIWCEHCEKGYGNPQFRGVIQHVITGQRQYLNGQQNIIQFIKAQSIDNSERNQSSDISPPPPDQEVW